MVESGAAAAGVAIGGTISIIITGFFALSVFLGVVYGFSRGVFKTLIRLVTVILSVAIALIALSGFVGLLESNLTDKTLSEVVSAFSSEPLDKGTVAVLDSFDTHTVYNLLLLMICLIGMPIAFLVVFFILKLLTLIVYAILSSVLGFGGKYKSMLSRSLGALVGAVQGAFIAIVVLAPFVGVLGIAEDVKEPLLADASEESEEAIVGFYDSVLDDAISNPIYKFSRFCGGDFIYSTLTAANVDGKRVVMRDQAVELVTIYTDCAAMGEVDWLTLSEDNKNVLVTVVADIGENEYTASIISGVLRGVGTAVSREAIVVNLEEPLDDFATSLLSVFKDTTPDTLKGDLDTFLEIYFILSDSGVLAHFGEESGEGEDVKDLFTAKNEEGKTVIQEVIDELQKNPRTAHIVTDLTKFSLKLMADSVGNALPEDVDTEKLYSDVKVGMTGALDSVNDPTLTPEEKKESVKGTISDTLIESGVMTEENKLDDDIMDSMADYVIENYQGKEELTDEDINNAILHYYEAYADKEAAAPGTPDTPGAPETPDAPGTSDTPGTSDAPDASGTPAGSDGVKLPVT